ncbi:MAG: protein kinase, partial [Planctomycetales bacterium]|nr:protein kinase [Planctomycetales bacterium]
LGRGGMGIVFRAYHPLTDRTVALKVILRDRFQALPRGSQSSILERFRNEVQAAARLDHDHIVTIYEVGEVGGDQYYAMRYVRGSSLGEIVGQGPIAARRAVRYLEGVAQALQVAHQEGVLHRDLKPQNILIDEKTDRALVTDFGLAKLQEAGEELTRAGDVVGTPSYMAPEQARDAARVTAAADIYGLGATLYQLLTGRPPFQAATPVETLRQVMDEEPAPPSQLNPAIDRDVETICVKCLQKEPERRYPTAAALAADFGRYLRGEPIEARPLGALQRGLRWCRRNPLLAGAAATAAACLAIALTASLIGYVQTSAALAKSEKNYRLAQSAWEEAEQSYELARATIDGLYTQVSENDLLNVPGMQPLRHDLLNRALGHYQDFVARRAGDDRLLRETGLAQFRMANITSELDSPAAALPMYEKALRIQRKLVEETPQDPATVQELAATWNAMGATYRQVEQLDQAMNAFEKSLELRQQLFQQHPANKEYQRQLANTLMNIGVLHTAQHQHAKARKRMDDAQRLRHQLIEQDADHAGVHRDLGKGYFNLGKLAVAEGKAGDAAQNLQRALLEFEMVHKLAPEDLDNAGRQLLCHRVLGYVFFMQAQAAAGADTSTDQPTGTVSQLRQQALQHYDSALNIARDLVQRNPQVIAYQRDLAGIHIHLAKMQFQHQLYDQAAESYAKAQNVLQPIAERAPLLRWDLAKALHGLGFLHQQRGNFQQAAGHLQQAKEHLQILTGQFPDREKYRRDLQQVDTLLAELSKQSN